MLVQQSTACQVRVTVIPLQTVPLVKVLTVK